MGTRELPSPWELAILRLEADICHNLRSPMKTSFLILIIFVFACQSQAALQVLTGFDVRKKTDRYQVLITPENSILEERSFTLFKIDSSGRKKIQRGDVVFTKEDMGKDIEAVYQSDSATLQFGRLVAQPNLKNGRRVVVLKLNQNKTLVFEATESLFVE